MTAIATPTSRQSLSVSMSPALHSVVVWYFAGESPPDVGSGWLPFYCDPQYVGAFAVSPEDLAAGTDGAVFKLFVALSMFQALRDVVIMRHQRSLPHAAMRVVADAEFVGRAIAEHACPALTSPQEFEATCDAWKRGAVVDCGRCPGVACHVKDATIVFNRMGDMGKLPTSALLRLREAGGMAGLLASVCRDELSPTKRAALLVDRFTDIHRVGRKLATMFVSALSTPALAPGLTPWFPAVDGSELVVVDTNVARAVDALRAPGAPRTYDARDRWVREQASLLNLRDFRSDVPRYSPRLVQQSLYAFCSKSNRVAHGDACAGRTAPCDRCVAALCPFQEGSSA